MPGTPEELELFAEVEAADGSRFALAGLPHEDASRPVVLLAPAMGTPARFYRSFVGDLHNAGGTPLVFDHRGNGRRAGVPPTTGYRQLSEDLREAISGVRSRLPQAPLTVCGHSLGGQLALLQAAVAAARGEPGPDALVLVAAGSVHYRAFGARSLRLLAGSQFMALAATALGHWPGHRLGFGGRQPAGVIRDWAHQARTGRYRLDGAEVEDMLPRLCLPLLVVDVEGDRLAPPGAVSHLCGKVPAARLERRAYTSADAGGAPLDHFRWARYAGPLARTVVRWAYEAAD